jgi:hypothetical protein
MFKKILLKSVVGATAVGSALTMSAVAAPSVLTSAPEISNVACSEQYPGSVSTTTQLKLSRAIAQYGSTNVAHVTVSGEKAGDKANGSVTFTLTGGGVSESWTKSVKGGQASVTLPRKLAADNTYTVRAEYTAGECSVFKDSESKAAYYSVNKANTMRRVNAPNVDRGQRARVTVAISSARPGMFTPRGQVRIVVSRGGDKLATKTVRLEGGRALVKFGKFRPGSYDVAVRYFGTGNFKGARGTDGFRVRR